MKHILSILLILSFLTSYSQNDSIGVCPIKDDGSPFNWITKYMWVGLRNPIISTYHGSSDFIKVWTDNGSVDSGSFYLTDYCITPRKTGRANVYSIQQIWTGKKYDTVSTKNSFMAITPPKIIIKITQDNFRIDSTIQFVLIQKEDLKLVDERYQVGRMFEPQIYDNNDSLMGRVNLCFGTKINFAKRDYHTQVKSGYKIKIQLLVRDMKADLLIPTDEITYTLK